MTQGFHCHILGDESIKFTMVIWFNEFDGHLVLNYITVS